MPIARGRAVSVAPAPPSLPALRRRYSGSWPAAMLRARVADYFGLALLLA
jgi:hypothetical protein